jgi:hypothetical protein
VEVTEGANLGPHPRSSFSWNSDFEIGEEPVLGEAAANPARSSPSSPTCCLLPSRMLPPSGFHREAMGDGDGVRHHRPRGGDPGAGARDPAGHLRAAVAGAATGRLPRRARLGLEDAGPEGLGALGDHTTSEASSTQAASMAWRQTRAGGSGPRPSTQPQRCPATLEPRGSAPNPRRG